MALSDSSARSASSLLTPSRPILSSLSTATNTLASRSAAPTCSTIARSSARWFSRTVKSSNPSATRLSCTTAMHSASAAMLVVPMVSTSHW